MSSRVAYLVLASAVLQEEFEPFPSEDGLVVTAAAVALGHVLAGSDLGLSLLVHDVHVASHLALDEGVHDRETLLRVADEADGVVQPRILVRRDFKLAALDANTFGDLLHLVDEACECRGVSTGSDGKDVPARL